MLKIGLILSVNFYIAKSLPPHLVPAATWLFNIAILFLNELCDGYRFISIAQLLISLLNLAAGRGQESTRIERWGHWADNHGGLVPRWHISFNITVLRLISFNMDYYWSSIAERSSLLEV